MDRRGFLGAAAAAPLLSALPAAAHHGTSMAQAPGFYRFKVGGFTVTTVHDGFTPRQNPARSGMVANQTPEAVEAAMREALLPLDRLDNPFTVTFLDTGRQLIAFDTGTGGGQLSPTSGLLEHNLEAAGIDPARVSLVLVSHFHGDHVTGLTTRENAAVFPNAEVAVPAAEWAFWTDEGNSGRVPEMQRGTFANVRRRFGPYQAKLRRFDWDQEVAPGVRALNAAGHTPGHTVFHVADGAEQLFVMADTSSRPELFLRYPHWASVFDLDAAMATESRRRVFGRAAAERARITAYHFPFPANGYVAPWGEGFRFIPADWSSTV
ncbi:MBL fold metallo-hydrolase [Paracraurococcus ruber]|nr:MBL fold metallo-hydrolase [Paracraurococcus ruber]